MRRYKLLLNFSDCLVRPTRLIIFVHRFCRLVIGQYFESGILLISAGQSGDERQGSLNVWGRTQQSEKFRKSL